METMDRIYFDSAHDDERRRRNLYSGALYVFSPRQSLVALCEHARALIEEAFGGLDPRTAQYHMPVERYVEICAPLKPRFIHHPRTKELVRQVLVELGCDLDETFQDVPRLRMVTSDGYLTSGVGYAHHPHRDTWYSAPMNQINWWVPIYEFEAESGMAFHPRYWSRGVRNGSEAFNYYEWNAVGRRDAAKMVHGDTRKQPKAEEELIELEPSIRLVVPVGGAILFSAAQMHSTVPNTTGSTRYSMDFRTSNLLDLRERRAAPNLDSRPHGTSLRDFLRARDLAPMPAEVVSMYDDASPADGVLVFRPQA